jgi:hypothetical protein
MRLFCELFLVAVLIWLGWSQSFHDRFDQMRGVQPAATVTSKTQASPTSVAAATTAPAPRQPFIPRYAPPRPASTASGDWMWDPAHRNPLDRPSYKTGDTSAQENAQKSSQNYWIDSRGVRHTVTSTPSP